MVSYMKPHKHMHYYLYSPDLLQILHSLQNSVFMLEIRTIYQYNYYRIKKVSVKDARHLK